MKKRPETVPHPLFHSLVIMGGSAAVACGGVASGEGGSGVGDPSMGGGVGSGGNPGTGGSPGTGGTFETGGATASGGSGGVMVFPCPEAQYTCNETQAQQLACNFSPLDPGGCTCDSTRPTSEAQCGPSELFACRMVQAYDPDAGAYAAKYVFDCKCAAVTPDSDGCKAVFDGQIHHDGYEAVPIGHGGTISQLLCGCAWVLLR